MSRRFNLTDNLSYKGVAFGVALVLWASMLGRMDSTMTKEFEVQVALGPNLEMVTKVPQNVRVEITGPRVALKKLNQVSPVFTVDLTAARPGPQIVKLNRDGLSLPIGARVLSIEPREFMVQLKQTKSAEGVN